MNNFNIEDLNKVVSSSFKKRETDTTLLENTSLDFEKKSRRKVIKDSDITPELFDLLVTKAYEGLTNPYEGSQEEIINILYPLNVCNKTIARVVNYLIPSAKATQGSIASMIRFLNSKHNSTKAKRKTLSQQLADELFRELAKENV